MLLKGKTSQEIAEFCDYPMNLIKEVQENLREIARYVLDDIPYGNGLFCVIACVIIICMMNNCNFYYEPRLLCFIQM